MNMIKKSNLVSLNFNLQLVIFQNSCIRYSLIYIIMTNIGSRVRATLLALTLIQSKTSLSLVIYLYLVQDVAMRVSTVLTVTLHAPLTARTARTCHIENGTCFLCKPGWTGLDCNISMNTSINISYFKCCFFIK